MRAVAIIAIVLGHVARGLASAGVVDAEASAFQLLDRILYGFHLPVFAFVSGLFIRQGVDRDGAMRYVRQRVATFVYLYLLWTAVQGAVKLIAGSLVNSPTSIVDILSVWRPDGQLWFLPFVALLTTVAAAVRPWSSAARGVIVAIAAVAVSLLTWGVNGQFAGTQGLGLTAFFFAGVLIGSGRFIGLLQDVARWRAAFCGLVLTAAFVTVIGMTPALPPTVDSTDRGVAPLVFGMLAAVLGVGAVALLGRAWAADRRVFTWLVFVGQRSLEIFLAHIVAAAGTRIVLISIGVDDPVVHVLLGLAAGVGLPLALWVSGRALGFPWLFQAPRFLTGSARETRSGPPNA